MLNNNNTALHELNIDPTDFDLKITFPQMGIPAGSIDLKIYTAIIVSS